MAYLTPTLKTGELAYFDSFAGPVPCKVVSIASSRVADFRPGSWQDVKAVCTADRGTYRKGETLQGQGLHFFPRKALRKRSGQFRIWPYRVEAAGYQVAA